VRLSELLRQPVTDKHGGSIGRLSDVIVRLRGAVVRGVDTHRRPRRLFGSGAPANRDRQFREWEKFEPLIGHVGSAVSRRPFGRVRRLKPAQIADLLEEAAREEESEIIGQVRADPELEADVFEELADDMASRLLGARTDTEIAQVLARMRADDVALLMSDYNLITIPVVDERRKMIGVITVDDVLEATLPEGWRRRETADPADAHAGEHGSEYG